MSPSFRTFFKVVSATRLLVLVLVTVLYLVWDLHQPGNSTGSGISLHFSVSVYLFIYSFSISYIVNTILSLVISFRPEWMFTTFLRNRGIPLFFYIIELLVLPFLLHLCYGKVQETFFPSTNTIQEILNYLVPSESANNVYEKYETINFLLGTIASFCFVLTFWKFYNARKKEYELSEQPA